MTPETLKALFDQTEICSERRVIAVCHKPTDLYGFGYTLEEACRDLKLAAEELFSFLSSLSPDQLGPIPERQLRDLRAIGMEAEEEGDTSHYRDPTYHDNLLFVMRLVAQGSVTPGKGRELVVDFIACGRPLPADLPGIDLGYPMCGEEEP